MRLFCMMKAGIGLVFSAYLLGCQSPQEGGMSKGSADKAAGEKLVVAAAAHSKQQPSVIRTVTFGWPFLDPEKLQPRGGITRGSIITLDTAPSQQWLQLQEQTLTPFEKDRQAILAMQGAYRASFQFIEAAGFVPDYFPARPYFSWGTEYVHLLEDRGDFISLQHTLVMYFQEEDGKVLGPMIMKHWRQDWQYQDQDIHTFVGGNQWQHQAFSAASASGRWSQFVFQVDDSPRYQVMGQWQHSPQFSSWHSDAAGRPLPRREFSVRDDYNLLNSQHTVTLTPTGWVHFQNSQKVVKSKDEDRYLAQEIGINRYERIKTPDIKIDAEAYWQATAHYWAAVRAHWAKILSGASLVTLKSRYEDRKLYQHHFEFADRLYQGEKISNVDQAAHAEETIQRFLGDVVPMAK